MIHELFSLMRECPFGTFIIILSLIWAVERTIRAIALRNKPDCDCRCCEEEDDDEVLAGGSEEDES